MNRSNHARTRRALLLSALVGTAAPLLAQAQPVTPLNVSYDVSR